MDPIGQRIADPTRRQVRARREHQDRPDLERHGADIGGELHHVDRTRTLDQIIVGTMLELHHRQHPLSPPRSHHHPGQLHNLPVTSDRARRDTLVAPSQGGQMPDELVILINVFDVPPEDGNRFLAAWEKVRDYLETRSLVTSTRPYIKALRPGRTSSS
jgi:hypothetical protein